MGGNIPRGLYIFGTRVYAYSMEFVTRYEAVEEKGRCFVKRGSLLSGRVVTTPIRVRIDYGYSLLSHSLFRKPRYKRGFCPS